MRKIVSLLLAVIMLTAMPICAAADSADFDSIYILPPGTETADTPDSPPGAATPDTPELPNMVETTDSPDDPETEDSPDTPPPDTPDTPETPAAPDTPDTPDIPITPDKPDTPETRDTPPKIDDTDSDKPQPEPPPVDKTPMGDVNGDNTVTSDDALLVLRYSVGYKSIDEDRLKYGDMNDDKVIDSSDAITILRMTVSLSADNPSKSEGDTKSYQTAEPQPKDYSTFKRGIDVSAWQGYINFNAVKASGIDFVIIRAGYGRNASQKDAYFEQNYRNAKAAGLDVGAYWYSYAESAYDAQLEAQACMSCIRGKKFEYPIYFDIEESWQYKAGSWFCSSLVNSFCSTLEQNGYYTGFYTYTSFANNVISSDVKSRYTYWAAEWTGSLNYYNLVGIWQYGFGYINGVNGEVDLNYSYIDFPAAMKDFHLNGY